MSTPKKLITCEQSFQAHLIKGRLEAEGIPSFIANDNMNFVYGGINTSITGVDIYVNNEDFDKAKAILDSAE